MKSINLLPRVPLSRRLFVPVIAAVMLLTAAIAAGILLLHDQYKLTNRLIEAEIGRLEGQMAELAASEQPPRYADVQAYRSLVAKLEESNRDWESMFELAAGLLPRASSISAISADENGKVTLAVRMPGLTEIAAYAAALRETGPIADAAVISIQQEDSAQAAAGQAGSVYTAVIELRMADQSETQGAGP